MYVPKPFEINGHEDIYDMIEKYSFAPTLFSLHCEGPFATHLPLLVDREKGMLYGHLARQNPQWKDITDQEVLAVFHGPHSYISPSWYETTKAVPTWNYVAIHAYGQVEIVQNKQELINSLCDLIDKYEEPDSFYNFNDIEQSYIKGLSEGIVGFKIKINRLEGKQKLSQNHTVERQKLVIKELLNIQNENSYKIAELMMKNVGMEK